MPVLQNIRLNVFQGMQNIPNLAAEARGFFAAEGLSVTTTFTKSSQEQRDALRLGQCDIAHSAVDNAFALIRDAGFDVSIVVGLDHGFNKIMTRAGLFNYDDLRGKILAVDAPDTAFALLAYDVLARRGLQRGRDYQVSVVGATPFRLDALIKGEADFSLLNLPFNLLAQEAGCYMLDDPAAVVGDYQATCGFVSKAWVADKGDVLVRYLRAYIAGLNWARDPANRDELFQLALGWFNLSPGMTQQCLDRVLDPVSGFAPNAAINQKGLAETARLRESFQSDKPAGGRDLLACVDERFYQQACA